MAVLSLKDGSVETILQPEDFQQLICDKLGFEAEKYFEELIESLEKEIEEASEVEDSDLFSYECSLEANTDAFQEIEAICRTMISDFHREEGRNRLAALRPWFKNVSDIQDIANKQI